MVVAGGGVAALEAVVALGAMAPGAADVVLVAPTDVYVDRPWTIGEPFGLGRVRRYPLGALCAEAGARHVLDVVHAVRADEHRVVTGSGAEIDYDLLVCAPGARRFPAFEHGVTFDRETAPEDFDDILGDVDLGFAPRVAIVVPDGVTWTLPAYELAVLMAGWSRQHLRADTVITLFTPEPSAVAMFGSAASDGVADLLAEEHVALRTGVHPDVVTATALRAGGGWHRADRIVSLPKLSGPALAGLPNDAYGFIRTEAGGRVVGRPDIYAAGDGTDAPIKQGGLAAQQALAIATDIAIRLGAGVRRGAGGEVLRGVLRTPAGPRFLRAELDDPEGTSTISAEPLWWPPSKISSRHLAPLLARHDVERGARAGVL